MRNPDNYLMLDETTNAMDYLVQSLVFLSEIEKYPYNMKWFVISFHGAVHSFMLLTLQRINENFIYTDRSLRETKQDKTKLAREGRLKDFMSTYKSIKNKEYLPTPFNAKPRHDKSMRWLNNDLRNPFVHFIPLTWIMNPWHPAKVCKPLLDILNFCIKENNIYLEQRQQETAIASIESMKTLLNKHIRSEKNKEVDSY